MSRSTLISIVLVVAVVGTAGVAAWWNYQPVKQTHPPYVSPAVDQKPQPQTARLPLSYVPAGTVGGQTAFETHLAGIVIDREKDVLYAVGDRKLRVFDHCDRAMGEFDLPGDPLCVGLDGQGGLLIGMQGQVQAVSTEGEAGRIIGKGQLGQVTAVAGHGGEVLAADATAKKIRRFDPSGKLVGDIPSSSDTGDGRPVREFTLPNGWLDIALDAAGRVVAPNPGRHLVEAWTAAGKLVSTWGKFSETDIAGFSGCCNPINVATFALPGGGQGVVTAEKAIARVKVYDAAGGLKAVIGPEHFDQTNTRMPLAVDAGGRIYVADTNARVIRRFRPDQ